VDLGTSVLGSDAALALFRTAQEGISNALRHGQARSLQLDVLAAADAVTLCLRDDGQGLAPDWSARAGHYGLRWLTERVESLGGQLHVEAAQPHGVCLRASLPLQVAEIAGAT
jgi:two-component system, NarL family, sensor histidine kinase UhpB